jgi:plasmid stabilization system protein ParE
MRLRYSRRAIRHLYRISAHIAQDSPVAAVAVGQRLHEVVVMLSQYPKLGHGGAAANTREFPLPDLPYVIVYRVIPKRNELRIAGIVHGAQLRPGQTAPETED